MVVIYADILLALNWWVDFLLLIGVARVAGVGVRPWRLVLGAGVGALFSGLLFLPALPALVSLLAKFFAALIMVSVTFGFCRRRRFAKLLALLFGISAGFSGLCSAAYFFVGPQNLYVFNGVVYYAVSPWLLIGLTLLCYGFLTLLERIARRRAPIGHSYCLHLTHDNRSITVKCLYDSGNHLVEPFSNRPVVVVERAQLELLLYVPEDCAELPPNGLWRVVPFDSLGGGGLLPAFSPHRIAVLTEHGEKLLHDCYVAVCDHLGHGEYQGLLGSALGEQLCKESD